MDLLAKYTSLFTLATVIIGWIVVNWQNNNREERKEVRSSLSDVLEEIIGLEDLAVEYHTAQARSNPKEREITSKITRLSAKVRHLRFESSAIKNLFIKLKQAITLDNFETNRFVTQGLDSEILELIEMYSGQLQDELESEFSRSFRAPFAYRLASAIRRFLIWCKP